MSDNAIDAAAVEDTTPQADPAPVEAATAEQAEPAADSEERSGDRGSREAAKYRRQLRDAEAARDQLAERLAALQRGQAETFAREHLADGADLWRDGVDLTALLDDGGQVDPDKVREAARSTIAAHRHWAAPRPPKRNPTGSGGGLKSGATGRDDYRPATSWQKVLNTTLGDD